MKYPDDEFHSERLRALYEDTYDDLAYPYDMREDHDYGDTLLLRTMLETVMEEGISISPHDKGIFKMALKQIEQAVKQLKLTVQLVTQGGRYGK